MEGLGGSSLHRITNLKWSLMVELLLEWSQISPLSNKVLFSMKLRTEWKKTFVGKQILEELVERKREQNCAFGKEMSFTSICNRWSWTIKSFNEHLRSLALSTPCVLSQTASLSSLRGDSYMHVYHLVVCERMRHHRCQTTEQTFILPSVNSNPAFFSGASSQHRLPWGVANAALRHIQIYTEIYVWQIDVYPFLNLKRRAASRNDQSRDYPGWEAAARQCRSRLSLSSSHCQGSVASCRSPDCWFIQTSNPKMARRCQTWISIQRKSLHWNSG